MIYMPKKQTTKQVRLDQKLARMIKLKSTNKGITMVQFLNSIVRQYFAKNERIRSWPKKQ